MSKAVSSQLNVPVDVRIADKFMIINTLKLLAAYIYLNWHNTLYLGASICRRIPGGLYHIYIYIYIYLITDIIRFFLDPLHSWSFTGPLYLPRFCLGQLNKTRYG